MQVRGYKKTKANNNKLLSNQIKKTKILEAYKSSHKENSSKNKMKILISLQINDKNDVNYLSFLFF